MKQFYFDEEKQDSVKREKRLTKKPLRESEQKRENVRQARRNKTSNRWG